MSAYHHPAITATDVTVMVGHQTILRAVSLRVSEGRITGLIGPSGAGKTTLIRSLVGLQRLSAGSITVLGLPAGAAALRSQVSYMTQAPSVYPDLTVAENLRYFASMHGLLEPKRSQMVSHVLATVDLVRQADQLVEHLSGGQRQRVSLGVALLGTPRLLVLDEPTVGLDPVLRQDLWRVFRKLADHGMTLVVSSHAMDEAERCDDLILLREGEVLAHDTPAALMKRTRTKTVEASFLKLVGEKV